MDNLISRSEFQLGCDLVDSVSGTISITRCTENNAARLFPSDPYLEYLQWLGEYVRDENAYLELMPADRLFEVHVNEVLNLLEVDGSLYIPEYRSFLATHLQIRTAINFHLGMSWISDRHIQEAIRRKRQHWHE